MGTLGPVHWGSWESVLSIVRVVLLEGQGAGLLIYHPIHHWVKDAPGHTNSPALPSTLGATELDGSQRLWIKRQQKLCEPCVLKGYGKGVDSIYWWMDQTVILEL